MLSALTSVLILAVAASSDNQARHPDAVEIFHCDFDRPCDLNYDDWPDKWQRRFGDGLPHYVDATIENDETARGGQCLAVHVNGGGAHVESPCASVSGSFSYKFEARLRVAGVKHAKAQLRVEFCDEEKNVLQTAAGEWHAATGGWVDVQIGPVNPTDDRIQLARVVLHVRAGEQVDLEGQVSLDDVWMARQPKMSVKTNSPYNVYTNKNDVEVFCDLSGILDSDPDILFELLDASSQRLEGSRVQLDGQLIAERRSKASEIPESEANRRAAYAGSTSWRPPITKDGFYKVRVKMQTLRGMLKEDVVNIAVVPPLDRARQGEFGWSLAGDEIPIGFDDLATLLPRVAINWVKLPVWYGEAQSDRGDQIVVLAEKLAAKDIEVVGVVDRPPPEFNLAARLSRNAGIADTLSTESSAWLPQLDPVLTRLSLRVRWWQLGADDDYSFSTLGNLEREIVKLRDQLFRFGQDVKLGLAWRWNQTAGDGAPEATWDFQQHSASPGLTGEELEEYLKLPPRDDVRRWVLIEPLSRREYDLETRARDLVERMLAAKINGADAIFAAHPFNEDRGLMTERGTPGELLLPWRTTASLLSGGKYLGSIQLPQGSHNRLFATPDGDVLMVVWSDQPTREIIYLGEHIQVLDVWGREQKAMLDEGRQVIEVETLPRFVRGVNPHIARWHSAVKFAKRHVPSVFGKSHLNEITIHNSFLQGIGGSVELVGPEGWQISPRKIEFKLGADETIAGNFEVTLPFDASSGNVPIRADFVVDADRQYRFSVYLELNVGDGEVELETSTYLDDDGALIVEQRMVNHGDSLVDFKCLLFAPESGRRRQRTQVFRLGDSQDVKIYRYPDGADLLGAELWLRAEEVKGSRVLNHRFVVEQ